MYSELITLMVAYIKTAVDNQAFEVYDATEPFVEPESFASVYILPMIPNSPHAMLDAERYDSVNDVKIFSYRSSKTIKVRVDFRGVDCFTHMDLFESSFLLESKRALLKESGFGFLGLGEINPITDILGTEAKPGATATLTLSASRVIEDQSQVIKTIEITTTKTN